VLVDAGKPDVAVKDREQAARDAGGLPAHCERHPVIAVHRVDETDLHPLGSDGNVTERADPEQVLQTTFIGVL
jgi:hypothetical protein